MLPQDMRRRYLYLQNANCKEDIVSLLQQFVQRAEIDDMDRCWAYWNISDNLAMLRRPEEELKNHRRFAALLDTMEPVYLPWMVSCNPEAHAGRRRAGELLERAVRARLRRYAAGTPKRTDSV